MPVAARYWLTAHVIGVHAADDVEPSGDVEPEGHAAQTANPDAKVLDGHEQMAAAPAEPPLASCPGGHRYAATATD